MLKIFWQAIQKNSKDAGEKGRKNLKKIKQECQDYKIKVTKV